MEAAVLISPRAHQRVKLDWRLHDAVSSRTCLIWRADQHECQNEAIFASQVRDALLIVKCMI